MLAGIWSGVDVNNKPTVADRAHPVLNWVLALTTLLGAAVVGVALVAAAILRRRS